MTRLIRSRRVLWSSVAAITVAGGLAVAGVAGALPGSGTAPRARQASDAAQLSANARDHQAAGRRNTVLAGGSTPLAHSGSRVKAAGTFSDWPMFRGNPTHSGVSSETAISTTTAPTLTAGWTATIGTSSYVTPAVATSSSLGKAVVYAGAQSHFYAYPATGGSPIWTFKTGKGGGAFDASPAVFNGVVYDASTVGTIYALNAATGGVECSLSVGAQLIQASPVVVSDPDGSGPVLYLGTDPPGGAGAEYAMYGAGNSHGACTLDWKFSSWALANSGTWSPPAYGTDANGTPLLVFGSVDTDDSVYALNANTGALVWRHQTSTAKFLDVGSAPTISAPGTNGFAKGVVYVVGKDKTVYALNLTTGTQIWAFKLVKTSNGAVSSTALDGDTLYLGSNDGVYALNATTGALVWHVLAGPTFYASAVITGPSGAQVLVIGDNAGRLYALNLTNGSTVWTARPETAGYWASPAISQGTIYVAGLDGVLRTYSPS